MLLNGAVGLLLPMGSWQMDSLLGPVFTWLDLVSLSAFPLQCPTPRVGEFLSSYHMDL